MKKLFILTAIVMLTTTIAFPQAPQAMNYQAIARDAAGNIYGNQNISLRITITDGSGGTTLYQETHNTSTNQFGLFTLSVGMGTPVTGSFATISWGTVNAWMAVEYDPTGGTNYTLMGQSQLLSVPYALYAADGNPGPQGPQGNPGPQGIQGIPGADGATWFTGAGAPAGSLGVINDLYLDTNNGDYYKKTGASTWTLQGNLIGPQGPQGIQGPPGGSANLNGTTNYVVKFTPNGTTGGNSQIFDNGNSIGINTTSPVGKLHIKGNADSTQLVIDANSTQSNTNPLIKLRNNSGNDLMHIHSDNITNTFIGLNAGKDNLYTALNSGASNTFVGSNSGFPNTTGFANTSVGHLSFYNNTSGYSNTAVGRSALTSNTTGYENTAIGDAALTYNTTGNGNIAVGYAALALHETSGSNTAVGNWALSSDINGFANTAVGSGALDQNTSGSNNTAVGVGALILNTNGTNNSALGFYAGPGSSSLTNTTALGNNAQANVSNQVIIGSGVIFIGGPQNWTNTSDARIKNNVQENIPGLKFINLLRPVSYNKSFSAENKIIGRKDTIGLLPENNYERIKYTGFIAQEVEKAAKKISYDFSGVYHPQNERDLYGLRYAEFVVPLVKAVQELSAENENLKTENAEIKNTMEKLLKRIEKLEQKN